MSTVDAARERLILLEQERVEVSEQLEAMRAEYEAKVNAITMGEQALQSYRQEIREAHEELARAESLAEAQELSDEVELGVEELRARFESTAQGHVWFEGTGNDDAILPHQWQAAMFGAVADRWILGDGVGLGKTRTCVAWLDLNKAKKVIIVCEANVCSQFAGEVMELAPHRNLFNIAKTKAYQKGGVRRTAADVRHAMLDEAVSMDEAVVVVNFEIWRKDKDVLAKLLKWQADTVIVDEAHNLKGTSTANYKNVEILVATNNTCPVCSGILYGFWEPEGLKKQPIKYIPKPCDSCGWKKGDEIVKEFSNRLDSVLATRSVKNVCFTTGTPILNSPEDLYPLLHLCNPVMFKTNAEFRRTYLRQDRNANRWEFRQSALDNLKPLISGILIARDLSDTGVKLPPQHPIMVPIRLTKEEYPEQHRAITQLTENAQLVLDSGKSLTVMEIIALITRKRQANVWVGGIQVEDKDENSPTFGEIIFDASEIEESIKMDELMENIVKHHQLGQRQIVFSQFKSALAEFQQRLEDAGIRTARFDGDTKEKDRLRIKRNLDRKYGEEPQFEVLLANYKTGGTGLNFTAATVSHELDEEWNPGKRNQARGRTKRMGQTEQTTIYTYRIQGTIDTWLANIIRTKEFMLEGFDETMKNKAPEETGIKELAMSLGAAMKSGEVL